LATEVFERVLREQRPHVERLVQDIARHYHLAAHEIAEFSTLVEETLERNDYELLRAFDRRSTWETYLSTVLTRLFFEFQLGLWGQWRPSAASQALGPAAMLLEELVRRDRLPLADAIELMRSTHRVDLSRQRIESLARELHLPGDPGRHQSAAEPDTIAEAEVAPDPTIQAALSDAIALLSPEDRLLLAMRYVDRQPITRIAKLLRAAPRPLQRRIEQAKDVLRTSLLTQQIAIEDVDALILQAEVDANSPHRKWWMLVLPHP
jgi:DNA-directed RNA polymerase specialized sigma24 family protein